MACLASCSACSCIFSHVSVSIADAYVSVSLYICVCAHINIYYSVYCATTRTTTRRAFALVKFCFHYLFLLLLPLDFFFVLLFLLFSSSSLRALSAAFLNAFLYLGSPLTPLHPRTLAPPHRSAGSGWDLLNKSNHLCASAHPLHLASSPVLVLRVIITILDI